MKHQAREERKQSVIRMWEERYPNITVKSVEQETGLSYRTIYRYLKEAGQPLPPKPKKAGTRRIDMEKVRRAHALFSKHQNKAEVARIMEMSVKQISRYLKIESVDD